MVLILGTPDKGPKPPLFKSSLHNCESRKQVVISSQGGFPCIRLMYCYPQYAELTYSHQRMFALDAAPAELVGSLAFGGALRTGTRNVARK